MDALRSGFRVGEWRVEPRANRVRRDDTDYLLEPRVMDLLVFLASNARETVSKDEIFAAVWAETFVTDNTLWKCVFDLRQILEEEPSHPRLIVNVPRRGYRLNAVVEPLTAEANEPPPSTKRRGPKAAVAIVFLLLLLGTPVGLWWWMQSGESGLSNGDRSVVLMAQLENRTREELLDGTLEVVLEGRLNDSGWVHLVSRQRIEDSLLLMREALDSPLTTDLARKVSLRDGGIDFVVTGQIHSVGATFQVTLRILDGHSDELVASNDLKTGSLESILPLIDEQAAWLVRRLGSENAGSPQRSERVTTESLEALKLYTEGVALYGGAGSSDRLLQYKSAAHLFEGAAKIDPKFASAHLMLAWSLFQLDQHDPQRSGSLEVVYRRQPWVLTRPTWEAIQRAMETRANASLVEQAFIQGCFFDWKGEAKEAAAFYRVVARLQPEHHWATNNLLVLGLGTNDKNLIVESLTEDSRRRGLIALGNNLRRIVQITGDLDGAQELRKLAALPADNNLPMGLREAEDLSSVSDLWHQSTADLWAHDIWFLWQQGRYVETREGLDELGERIEALGTGGVDAAQLKNYAVYLSALRAALGQLDAARATWDHYELPAQASLQEPLSPVELRCFLTECQEPSGDTWFASLFFFDPKTDLPRLIDRPSGPIPPGSPGRMSLMTRGLVSSLQASRSEERIAGLNKVLDLLRVRLVNQLPIYSFATRWKLARELMELGRDEEAVAILEEIVADRNRTWVTGIVFWQKAALDLARAYRRQNRPEDAEPLLSDLAAMLQFADPDHPIVSALREEYHVNGKGDLSLNTR